MMDETGKLRRRFYLAVRGETRNFVSTVPTGLRFNMRYGFPTLKRGANEHCTYGAWQMRRGERRTGRFI